MLRYLTIDVRYILQILNICFISTFSSTNLLYCVSLVKTRQFNSGNCFSYLFRTKFSSKTYRELYAPTML